MSTASLSHSSEKPCTSDHAASAAPSGSALGVRVAERADAAVEFGSGGRLGGDEVRVGVVVERLVEHHRVVPGVVEREPHVGPRGVDEPRPWRR